MPEFSRSQLAVYVAVGVALLLIGARALRREGSDQSGAPFGGEPSGVSFRSGGAGGGDLVVDVTGAVRRPGVFRLPAGARVNDAVRRAGGPTGSAEVEAVNLAARLADGQQVVVPDRAPSGAGPAASAAGEDAPISLGTATAEQLDSIEGIGPVTAQDIIEFRDQHGGLASVEQLNQISGIGPATMEALRARLQP
ncbi:MAG: helix-hairpin-helix domain-containing protein [Solirubrobacterales bacterium]